MILLCLLFVRLSEFVCDETQSADLVRLLLPFLGRRLSRSLTVEADVLTAVKHLICQVKVATEFIPWVESIFYNSRFAQPDRWNLK